MYEGPRKVAVKDVPDARIEKATDVLVRVSRTASFGSPPAGHPPRVARAVETLIWWVVLVGVWLSTLSTVSTQELVVAACCGLVCAVLATTARAVYRGSWRPARAWTLPVEIARDCATLFSRESAIRSIGASSATKAVRTIVRSRRWGSRVT